MMPQLIFVDEEKIPSYPYPKLKDVLTIFVDKQKQALGENLLGVYLVGSLASGDFDLDSDIDFLCVIKDELEETDIKALPKIQKNIQEINCYPAKHLEGSYITERDLTDWNVVGKKLYYFDNGSTSIEQSTHDNKWHVRWILREGGITLIGQKPKTFLESIPIHELINEIRTTMVQGLKDFETEIKGPLSFSNSRFGQSFYVLTYCRMLHTIYSGTVQSKKISAEWAKQTIDTHWTKIIDQAWEERKGVRFGKKIGQRANHKLLQETMMFMKYCVSQIDKHDCAES